MKELIGKKIGMTRIFIETGEAVPVSVIEAGPCVVVAKRTTDKHGYEAVQVGFGDRRKNLFNKPIIGHFEKAGSEPKRFLKEIKTDNAVEVGDELKADIFKKGERVDVTGISKGLGFQGAMRRHGFGGAQKTHGQSDRWRAPGSIGSSSYPSRVYKGMRMAGKTGKDKITVLNLEIVQVIDDQNLILVKGAVPGKNGTFLKIRKSNRSR
ncbi:MAG: 50S ribosomal protein L3 [Candidatus Zixiibacteriota bacterium]